MHATCFVSVVHSALSNVSAAPHHDGALMVRWRSVASNDLKGFIVEWRPLLNKTISLIQFETTDRNRTSLLLKGRLYSSSFMYFYPNPKDNIRKHVTLLSDHVTAIFFFLNSPR